MTQDASLEAIYDAEISPLMVHIIAICKRENLPMYASFYLGGDLGCTTHIPARASELADEDREEYADWEAKFGARANRVGGTRSPLMITTRNAAGEVTAMTAVL